jgi:hypothetical protein
MALPQVVAAVDLGTHGVGFAWARIGDPDIHCPDWGTGDDPKELTALLVDADGAVVAWGHDAKQRALSADQDSGLTYYAHFKMGTAGATAVTRFDAVELTGMLLAQVYARAVATITTAADIPAERITWRLTVPAVWPDRERQLLRMAAERAGFPTGERLDLVIEPEAAVQYCCTALGLAVAGGRFVVVDVGAGLVDVASYAITGSGDSPKLAELGRATGGRFSVDAGFLDAVVAQLGENVAGPLLAGSATRLPFLDAWEQAKRGVDPGWENSLRISVRATARGGVDDAVVLPPAETRALFDHAIDPVIGLASEHIAGAGAGSPCSVLLVGGLAQSRYLAARFRQAFPEHQVLVPPRPAHAVLLGAVRSGLRPDDVVSRVSRFTYGVESNMPFQRGTDPSSRRFTDGYGYLRCRNRFSIFVRAGQSVEVGATVTVEFVPLDPADVAVRLPIHSTQEPDPRYTDAEGDGSSRVGELTVDVSATVGKPQQLRNILMTMTFGNAEITVRAHDLHTGTELSTTLDFVTVA